jgi:hypothetical protein
MFEIFRLQNSEFSETLRIFGDFRNDGPPPPDSACASLLIHGDFLLNARFPGVGPLLAKFAGADMPPVDRRLHADDDDRQFAGGLCLASIGKWFVRGRAWLQ